METKAEVRKIRQEMKVKEIVKAEKEETETVSAAAEKQVQNFEKH